MKPNDTPSMDDQPVEIEELALAWSLGELDMVGMQTFYDELRKPGQVGQAAAATTWRILDTTQALRITLNKDFQSEIQRRLDAEASPASDSFLARMFGRMGLDRPALRGISLPLPAVRRRWWLSGLLAAGLVAGGVVLFTATRDPGLARLESLAGQATIEAEYLRTGDLIGRRPVWIHAGSECTLRWPDGNRARILGSAKLVVQESGLSVLDGWASLEAVKPMICGLPDGRVVFDRPGSAVVEVIGAASLVGCEQGQLSFTERQRRQDCPAGYCLVRGNGPFTWRRSQELTIRDGTCAFPDEPSLVAWELRLILGFTAESDSIDLSWSNQQRLRLTPTGLILGLPGEPTRPLPCEAFTTGAPLRNRTISLRAIPDQELRLIIDGQEQRLPMPTLTMPATLNLTGGAQVRQLTFTTGPGSG